MMPLAQSAAIINTAVRLSCLNNQSVFVRQFDLSSCVSENKTTASSVTSEAFVQENEPPAVRRHKISISPDGINSEDGTFAYKQQRKIRTMMMMMMMVIARMLQDSRGNSRNRKSHYSSNMGLAFASSCCRIRVVKARLQASPAENCHTIDCGSTRHSVLH